MPEIPFTSHLTSGLNTKSPSFLIDAGECQDISNFSYSQEGILIKRFGSSAYGSSPVQIKEGDVIKAVSGLGRYYYPTGNKLQIVSAGTKIYKGDDETGAFTIIKEGLTDNAKTSFQQWLKYFLMVNGQDACMRYDGTKAWNMGLKRPATAPTLTGGIAGVLTGDFYYRVTFFNSNTKHESHPSIISEKITVADKKVDLSAIPIVADDNEADGIHRRIYRIGGATEDEDTPLTSVWQEVTTIEDNTTTTYTDNKKNSELGLDMGEDDTDPTCPLGNHEPPPAKHICSLHDTIYLAGCTDNPDVAPYTDANTVYPSKNEGGESYPFNYDFNYFKYGYAVGKTTKEKDFITGIIPFQDTIVVFQNNATWQLLGDDFDNYGMRLISPTVGQSGRTAVVCDDILVFWHLKTGVRLFDGARIPNPREGGVLSSKIEPTMLKVDPAKASDAIACLHKGKYMLFLP